MWIVNRNEMKWNEMKWMIILFIEYIYTLEDLKWDKIKELKELKDIVL